MTSPLYQHIMVPFSLNIPTILKANSICYNAAVAVADRMSNRKVDDQLKAAS